MEVTAVAALVAPIAGAASAAIAAFSALNSRRSAQASMAALSETRQQREIDNARQQLNDLGAVYDQAMILVEALAIELRRDPAAVERKREALRRSLLVAAFTGPALSRLVDAHDPLSNSEVAAVRGDFMARTTSLRNVIVREIR
jgi:hypothetical protein